EARVERRVIHVDGDAVEYTARAIAGVEAGVLAPHAQLRFLLGVKVIQVAVKLVEAIDGGQVLVAVAKVVLAELAGAVTQLLEQFGERRVALVDTHRRAWQTDSVHAGADRQLPGNKGGSPWRGAGVCVMVGEKNAFTPDAVDVGCGYHHAVA